MGEGFRMDIRRRSVAAVPAGFRGGVPRGEPGQSHPGGRPGEDRRNGGMGARLGQYAPHRGGRTVGTRREPRGDPDEQRVPHPARRGHGPAGTADGPRLLPVPSCTGGRVRAEPPP
jgi:hypothetical protein